MYKGDRGEIVLQPPPLLIRALQDRLHLSYDRLSFAKLCLSDLAKN